MAYEMKEEMWRACHPPVDTIAIPPELCPEHRRIAYDWRNHLYNSYHPTEWPGGSHIMDSRTSHRDRRYDWETKNEEQVRSVVRNCLSGRSPQCNHPEEG
jgi:hypothetical protein